STLLTKSDNDILPLCASGGKVTFNVGNDSPTLTGAKVTFTIDLEFPHNQKVQPDGDVVWAEDCIVNGNTSEPVYPSPNSDWEAVFPDGKPLTKDKRPAYVFVWKAWEGIKKVEIVQMDNSVMAEPGKGKKVVDITVTCQGSLPKEVCSVILDAECLKPIHTACNMVEPSKECQLVLRHFFNDSGIYCINVSMANDVSLAATSTKVNVDLGSGPLSSGTIAMLLGVLLLVLAVGIVTCLIASRTNITNKYTYLIVYRPTS
uniref:Premelanosome protein b n=1 Tax=Gouania willdenowi TaxID=441366 RepID=A0A8C5GE91_GOUWI